MKPAPKARDRGSLRAPRLAPNMCTLDRIIRLLIAAPLLYIVLFDEPFQLNPVVLTVLLLIALLNLVAALFARCPVYRLARISTYRPKNPAA